MNTATRPGADPDVQINEVVVEPSPRDIQIEAMTERAHAARQTELDDALSEDPGLAHNQAAIEREIDQSNAAAVAAGTLAPGVDPDLDGAASRTPMHSPAPPVTTLPAELAGDPLSEYIVMDKDQPMFQTKVNGEIRLIPLAEARRQIQIGTAAEIRMQQASSYEKETAANVNTREQQLRQKELAFNQRVEQATPNSNVPAQADLSDDDLLDEARDIFNTAFAGTEEDAARKLARTLSKLRAPAAVAQAPVIDENAIAQRAARAAVTAVDSRDRNKDVQTGYAQFQEDYPEIMNDAHLYKMADDMTDEIAKENPNWDISRVMDEAGTRTRAWVSGLKGEKPQIRSAPTVPQHPTQDRHARKAGLVRMPQAAASAVHQIPTEEPETEQTPAEAFAEIKASRGQPT